MARYFDKPFAVSGDKTVIPNNSQVDGSVSYETGFGYDYERDPDPLVDPLTKDVPRDQTNQLFFDITETLKQLQENGGVPQWYASIASTVGYPKGAAVQANGAIFESSQDNNGSEPGFSPTWVVRGPLPQVLVSIGALTPTANQMIYFTSLNVAALTALTSFGRNLISANNDVNARGILGISNSSESVVGLSRFATAGETNGGASGVAVQPFHLVAGSGRFGTATSGGYNPPNWGGMQERWGVVSVSGNSTVPVLGLHTTACTSVQATISNGGADTDARPPHASISGTGILIRNPDSTGASFRYFTKGY